MEGPPSCLETSEITFPTSEVWLEAILLEDVLISLRGVLLALMRINAFVVVVVEGVVQDLERMESRENERNDIVTIDNGDNGALIR